MSAGDYDLEPAYNLEQPTTNNNIYSAYNPSSLDDTTTDYDDRSRMYNDLYSNVYPAGYSGT